MTIYKTDISKAKALVRYLVKQGYSLSLDNGDGLEFPFTDDVTFICKELNASGEDCIRCRKDKKQSAIYLVYNDEPECLIADYSESLESIVDAFESTTTVGALFAEEEDKARLALAKEHTA